MRLISSMPMTAAAKPGKARPNTLRYLKWIGETSALAAEAQSSKTVIHEMMASNCWKKEVGALEAAGFRLGLFFILIGFIFSFFCKRTVVRGGASLAEGEMKQNTFVKVQEVFLHFYKGNRVAGKLGLICGCY